jgi:hypothetical protein
MTKKTDSRRKGKFVRCPAITRIRKERLASFVARNLGINPHTKEPYSRTAVSMWRRVPAKHVPKVSKLLRIARHRIRPDLYA